MSRGKHANNTRLATLEAIVADLQAKAGSAPSIARASGNYWTMADAVPHVQTGTAAGAVCIAGIVLVAQVTGLFLVSANASFSGDTTAKKYQMQLVSCVGGTGVFAGGVAQGYGGSRVTPAGPALPVGVPGGRILNADAAGTAATGLTFGAAPFTTGQVQQRDKQGVTLTGLLGTNPGGGAAFTANGGIEEFAAGGIMGNSAAAGAKTPFTLGAPVAFGIILTDISTGAEVWNIDTLDFTVAEIGVL